MDARARVVLAAALAACAWAAVAAGASTKVADAARHEVKAPIHRCGHDRLMEQKARAKAARGGAERERRTEVPYGADASVWQPIRIRYVLDYLQPGKDPLACNATYNPPGKTCTSADMITTEKRLFLVNDVLPRAKEWLQRAYRVRRVEGSLRMSRAVCSIDDAYMPLYVPVSLRNPGVADTDVVVFVTARPIDSTFLALASWCDEDQYGRPIAGNINFNPMNIVSSSISSEALPFRVDEYVHTAVHELHHLLGYSSAKFPYFIDRHTRAIAPADTVMMRGGRMVPAINSSTAVQAARLHFGCPTLRAVPLEDGGGSATLGSHWEKQVFMNEFITGTVGSQPVISNITLAVMHDSGYYDANFSMAETLLWGYHEGCEFVTGKCNPRVKENCQVQDEYTCTFTRVFSGVCNKMQLGFQLEPEYRYFNDSYLGGSDELADFCPYVMEFSDGDCRYGAMATGGFNFGTRNGLDSRCFKSSLVFGEAYRDASGSCHPFLCSSPDDLKVWISAIWYDCPWGESISAASFNGTLVCPAESEKNLFCRGFTETLAWPVIEDIAPRKGGTGTLITITGQNLAEVSSVVIGGFLCTDVTVVDATKVTAKVGPIPAQLDSLDSFTSSLLKQAKETYVVVNTTAGYTAIEQEAFVLDRRDFASTIIGKILEWLRVNIVVDIVIGLAVVGIIAIIVFLAIWYRRRRKQKNKVAPIKKNKAKVHPEPGDDKKPESP